MNDQMNSNILAATDIPTYDPTGTDDRSLYLKATFPPGTTFQEDRAKSIKIEVPTPSGRFPTKWVFFPKSQISRDPDGNLYVSEWIWEQKCRDVPELAAAAGAPSSNRPMEVPSGPPSYGADDDLPF